LKTFISICDDEKNISGELESFLIEILSKLNVKYEIDVYFSGTEICKKLEEGVHYDLIFLDIEFAKDEINGVEVGQFVRDEYKNHAASIVFISWERKYSMQLFDIQPLNFLIKPLAYDKVEQVVRRYLYIAGLWSSHFTYKIGHDTFKVQVKDIIYVESLDRKLILYLTDGRREEFYGSLKKTFKEQLQKFDFLFIHASYAVNYDYVAHYNYEEMKLDIADIILSVSQGRRKEIRAAYVDIMERRGM
jgi:DNA-binding LytR/AlgR family response regulator